MSNFSTAIQKEQIGIRFSVQIEGIPYVFLSDDIPNGPDGSAWAAPTSKGDAYTYFPASIDLSRSLGEVGAVVACHKPDSLCAL